jgi:hypothetical protein
VCCRRLALMPRTTTRRRSRRRRRLRRLSVSSSHLLSLDLDYSLIQANLTFVLAYPHRPSPNPRRSPHRKSVFSLLPTSPSTQSKVSRNPLLTPTYNHFAALLHRGRRRSPKKRKPRSAATRNPSPRRRNRRDIPLPESGQRH